MRAPQRGLIATKAVNAHVYEHVHVNDHVFVDVDVHVDVLVDVDVVFKSNNGVKHAPENVKLLLPPRHSRGISIRISWSL